MIKLRIRLYAMHACMYVAMYVCSFALLLYFTLQR